MRVIFIWFAEFTCREKKLAQIIDITDVIAEVKQLFCIMQRKVMSNKSSRSTNLTKVGIYEPVIHSLVDLQLLQCMIAQE